MLQKTRLMLQIEKQNQAMLKNASSSSKFKVASVNFHYGLLYQFTFIHPFLSLEISWLPGINNGLAEEEMTSNVGWYKTWLIKRYDIQYCAGKSLGMVVNKLQR